MTTDKPAIDIEAIRKRAEAATPGPWSYRSQPYDDWGVVRAGRFWICQARDPNALEEAQLNEHRSAGTDPWEANARLIAEARSDIPALCDALTAARVRIGELEARILEMDKGEDVSREWVKSDTLDRIAAQIATLRAELSTCREDRAEGARHIHNVTNAEIYGGVYADLRRRAIAWANKETTK